MENQEVKIIISKDGKIQMEVDGVKGKKCIDITDDIEKILGSVQERKLKPSYYDESDGDFDNLLKNSKL